MTETGWIIKAKQQRNNFGEERQHAPLFYPIKGVPGKDADTHTLPSRHVCGCVWVGLSGQHVLWEKECLWIAHWAVIGRYQGCQRNQAQATVKDIYSREIRANVNQDSLFGKLWTFLSAQAPFTVLTKQLVNKVISVLKDARWQLLDPLKPIMAQINEHCETKNNNIHTSLK